MKRFVYKTKDEMGTAAAAKGAELIKSAIAQRGCANIIVATGASQFEMLTSLIRQKGIDWSKVTSFHLDEYIGISSEHPASFRKYLKERFVDPLSGLKKFHYVEGDSGDAQKECERLGKLISQYPIDVAFVGIGENGHLAFNDPPADFETEKPYLVVQLDEACRKQQLGEGWFASLEEVPDQAISMSIRQIMKSGALIVTVPDKRKAEAVKGAVEGAVNNMCPSSILQKHGECHLYLDTDSASLLTEN